MSDRADEVHEVVSRQGLAVEEGPIEEEAGGEGQGGGQEGRGRHEVEGHREGHHQAGQAWGQGVQDLTLLKG